MIHYVTKGQKIYVEANKEGRLNLKDIYTYLVFFHRLSKLEYLNLCQSLVYFHSNYYNFDEKFSGDN